MQNFLIGAPLNSEPLPRLQWIESASSFQIPSFHIVGLPSQEVNESRERIRAAIESSGFEFPRRRIVLNLSPANIRKRGTGLDLAMALAILLGADAQENEDGDDRHPGAPPPRLIAWGELGLDGSVKPAGQLLRALYAAWDAEAAWIFISADEKDEAEEKLSLLRASKAFPGVPPRIIAVPSLASAWEALSRAVHEGPDPEPEKEPGRRARVENAFPPLLPLSPSLERTLAVASAGRHHILLLGPRGTGKTQALEWMIALQPEASPGIRIHQTLLAELNSPNAAPSERLPIRRVGVQARPAALIGAASGATVRPGEFALAHGGLLIADELPEWPRDSRESLREPLERKMSVLTRAAGSLELPADFLFAANGNFCPCGGWPPEIPLPREVTKNPNARCRCPSRLRTQYLSRLSGPVLDRVDIILRLAAQPQAGGLHETELRLSQLRARVRSMRERSRQLWGAAPGELASPRIEGLIERRPSWTEHLSQTGFASLRSRHKVVRLALSLALWDGEDEPSVAHFIEASCFRPERMGLA